MVWSILCCFALTMAASMVIVGSCSLCLSFSWCFADNELISLQKKTSISNLRARKSHHEEEAFFVDDDSWRSLNRSLVGSFSFAQRCMKSSLNWWKFLLFADHDDDDNINNATTGPDCDAGHRVPSRHGLLRPPQRKLLLARGNLWMFTVLRDVQRNYLLAMWVERPLLA